MVWTLAELDALKAAYASGATSVRWGDKSVNYDTRENLRRRIDEIEQELGTKPKGMQRRIVVVDNGLS